MGHYGIISHHGTSNHTSLVVAMRPYMDQGWEFLWNRYQTLGTQRHVNHWLLQSYGLSDVLVASMMQIHHWVLCKISFIANCMSNLT